MEIELEKIEVGQEIDYFQIGKEEFHEDEFGSFSIGANFLVFKDSFGSIVSFMLIGQSGSGNALYKCVWSDFDKKLH